MAGTNLCLLAVLTLTGCSALFPEGVVQVEWRFMNVAGDTVGCPVGEVRVIARDPAQNTEVVSETFACADGAGRLTVPVDTDIDAPPKTGYAIELRPNDGVNAWASIEKAAAVSNGGEDRVDHTFITDGGYAVISIRLLSLLGAQISCAGPPLIETFHVIHRRPDQSVEVEDLPCSGGFTSPPLIVGIHDYTVELRDEAGRMVAGSASTPVNIEDRDRRSERTLDFRIQD